MSNKNIKVAVGLSGGVDSAVSAYLLKEQGHDVTGVYMQCWDSKADGCRADEDRAEALRVAEHLGIPFKSLDFIKEYKSRVIDYFYKEYEAGRTPNPDVLCNKEIKFGMFLDWALENGFEKVATGHYARVQAEDGVYSLLKGVDETKDQSYFLYLLNQNQLSHAIFPVGGMKKSEVRKLAASSGLPNSTRPDSVGICFIGEVDMREFLKKKIKASPGNVVDKSGEIIGRHEGIPFYTVGQRHGFTVDKYFGLPLYVIGKNVERNELVVGFAADGQRDGFEVAQLHWLGAAPDRSFDCDVRIRHLGELYPANCILSDDKVSVRLTDKTFGVAPGQSAVFYDGEVVLGGGIIS